MILSLQNDFNEKSMFLNKSLIQLAKKLNQDSITGLKADYKKTSLTISDLIEHDEHLKHLVKILTSVPGVGNVIAIEMIILTNEFKSFPSAKKFASYCGVAPFENTSGISLRGRAKVSGVANRSIKPLLFMASMSIIQREEEIKNYFNTKVAEGKPKMKVLNAIENKLIHRMFACIKADRPYLKQTNRSVEPIVPVIAKVEYPS